MKKYSWLLIFIVMSLCSIKVQASSGRYFTKAESLKEAKEVAEKAHGILSSFSDGIAVIQIPQSNNEYTDQLIKASNSTSTPNNKIVKTDNKSILLEYDAVMTPAEVTLYNNGWYDPYEKMDMDPIDWFSAYYNNIKGKGATVCVLDTGCNVNHEDLSGQIIGTYNAVDGSTNVTDTDGHGTHISGIIAAKDNDKGIIGVAPECSLYIMKVDSPAGGWYYSDIIRGLNKCIELGNIDIINISASSFYYSELLEEAVRNCYEHGILIVSAAGNTATALKCYPAAFGYGISVGGYSSPNNNLYIYSNCGEYVDILAPADEVISSYINGSYMFMSGTSMAAGFVSGTAALIYGNQYIPKTKAGVDMVKKLIISSSNGKTYTNVVGNKAYGNLNIANIFGLKYSKPKIPKIKIRTDKETKQVFVTLYGTNGDIYYALDNDDPITEGIKYTGPIRFDGPDDMYVLSCVSINPKGISDVNEEDIEISEDVISQKKLESSEIYIEKINKSKKYKVVKGKKYKIKVENIGKNIKPNRFKWVSKNKKIATVNKNGVVTINKTAKKGSIVIIKAKLGTITREIKLQVK